MVKIRITFQPSQILYSFKQSLPIIYYWLYTQTYCAIALYFWRQDEWSWWSDRESNRVWWDEVLCAVLEAPSFSRKGVTHCVCIAILSLWNGGPQASMQSRYKLVMTHDTFHGNDYLCMQEFDQSIYVIGFFLYMLYWPHAFHTRGFLFHRTLLSVIDTGRKLRSLCTECY